MGNDKPEPLRRVENALWKALIHIAQGANQQEQLNKFATYTSDLHYINDIVVSKWFVKSTPQFHHFGVTNLGRTILRNRSCNFFITYKFGNRRNERRWIAFFNCSHLGRIYTFGGC